jgi:hypothetical protein
MNTMFETVIAKAAAEAIENIAYGGPYDNAGEEGDAEIIAVFMATQRAWENLNLPSEYTPEFDGTLTEEQVNAVCLTIMYCASAGAIHHLVDNREKGNPYQMLMSIAFDSIERIIQEAVNT